MKKSVFVVSLILLSFFLQTCREDESLSKGNVQFVFHVSPLDNSGGRSLFELPEGSVLLISIFTENGSLLSMEEFSILKFGDQYISEPIPLVPGDNYMVYDFFIRSGNEILFVTPWEDSPLAPLVEDPLPVVFSVTENEITNLNIEVVSTKARHPRDFGYVSFGIKVVPGELFKLAVFGPSEDETPAYTGAQAYVLLDDDTIFDKYLDPKVNNIFFASNPDDYYTLVLIEPSMKKYSRTFRVNELLEELDGNPLSVNMDPALTFSIATPYEGNSFEFSMNTDNPTIKGDLIIDWGDGTFEEIKLPRTNEYFLNHAYSNGGPHFVSVSGDLNAIESFGNEFSLMADISVKYLSELKGLAVVGNTADGTIDLSHNTKLRFASFDMSDYSSFDFTNNIKLKDVKMMENTHISTEAMDAIIHQLLLHAVNHNTVDGILDMAFDFEPPGHFVGPPSAAGFEELRTLRDNYGWYIYPENF